MITAIIVGAGHRALAYAELAKLFPEKMKIVGVADPLADRRKYCREYFGFGEDMCFESADELVKRGKLADAVINGTMDADHVPTTVPLLEAGYDVLGTLRFAEPTVEDRMVGEQIQRDLRALVEQLPEEQREVVKLRYFSGLSFREIAEQTDVSINTALGRMRYALINLRRLIKEKKLILN